MSKVSFYPSEMDMGVNLADFKNWPSNNERENFKDFSDSSANGVQFSGRWTKDEHLRFVEGLRLFGKDWKKIEDHVGSRSTGQIRSHAQKFFNRVEKEFLLEAPN